jgi:hypothetical protein
MAEFTPVSATELRLILSAAEIKDLTGWPDSMVEDYLNILSDLIDFATAINELQNAIVDTQFFMVETDDDPPTLPIEANPDILSTIRTRRTSGVYEDYVYEP